MGGDHELTCFFDGSVRAQSSESLARNTMVGEVSCRSGDWRSAARLTWPGTSSEEMPRMSFNAVPFGLTKSISRTLDAHIVHTGGDTLRRISGSFVCGMLQCKRRDLKYALHVHRLAGRSPHTPPGIDTLSHHNSSVVE